MHPVGRNDPCPCGSGLKYKKCCAIGLTDDRGADDGLTADRVMAYKAMSDEDWQKAVSLFRKVIDEGGDDYKTLEAIAACYDGEGNYLAAGEYLEKAIAQCPEQMKGRLTLRLGVIRACAERFDKSRDAFRECMRLAEEDEIRAAAEDMLRVVEDTIAQKTDGHSLRFLVEIQRVFTDLEEDRYESAAVRLTDMLSYMPNNPVIFFHLGVVYTFLKKEDKAIEFFRKTVELKPDYAQAWYNMGQINLIHLRDFSQALHCFDRAAASDPSYIGAQHQRGIAFEMLGDKKRAVACWEKTIELDPANEQARDNIARVTGAPAANQGKDTL